MATKVTKKKAAAETAEKVKEAKKKPAVKKVAAKKTAVKKESAKTAPKKTEVTNIKTNPGSYLVIDHPIEMETIYGNNYAIRVGASADGYVEISFNNGEWQPCRFGGGYWWYDWTYFTPGDYSIAVRLIGPDGNTVVETGPRKCRIC